MAHHILPQHYLRGFAVPTNPKLIWSCRRGDSCAKCIGIKNAAQQTKYYLAADEAYLAKIEQGANPVLDRLRANQFTMSTSQRHSLADYLAIMLVRIPKRRRNVLDIAPSVIENCLASLAGALRQQAQRDSCESEVISTRLAELDSLRNRFREQLPEDLIQELSRPLLRTQLSKALSQLPWIICVRLGGPSLITSDNPVIYSESIGLGNANSTFLFPVSSDVLILGTHGHGPSGTVAFMSSANAKNANQLIVAAATEFVFASRRDDSLCRSLASR